MPTPPETKSSSHNRDAGARLAKSADSTTSLHADDADANTASHQHEDRIWALMKIWGALGGLSLLLIFGGHFVADRYGALVGFLSAIALNSWVIWTIDWRLLHLFPSIELEGQDAWGLVSQTHSLAARHALPFPRLHIVEVSPTAYSAGLFLNRSHLFLSRSLLELLSKEELEAVVAVELARMFHQITRLATASCALVNLLAGFSAVVDQVLFLQVLRRDKPGQIRPMRLLVTPFVGIILRATFSQTQILKADRTAARWICSPHALAQALTKLDSYQKTRPEIVGIGDAHLFTVSPLLRFSWCKSLHTQPEVSARIAALTGHLYL